ncbi:hypothetical protein QVD17_15956 [Tagetes erecta]|uniref:RING-type E3 ubiquitin transferase n=1 Tax=Tagetes erecta TaxID=13708 RepID=A0AAD8KQU1_TARER|nr:hypothetical protein QVD17_15956 [Tagetes erecta]
MDLNPYPAVPIQLPYYSPLPYPYIWCIHQNQEIIVDATATDLNNNYQPIQQPPVYQTYHPHVHVDEALILNSFDQETEHCNGNGGLNNNFISKKLKVSNFRDNEEEGEVCVVCQVEFKSNERLGVLDCKHRFHSTCIRDWLMRQNVCPLCKCQALRL